LHIATGVLLQGESWGSGLMVGSPSLLSSKIVFFNVKQGKVALHLGFYCLKYQSGYFVSRYSHVEPLKRVVMYNLRLGYSASFLVCLKTRDLNC
jgi:hypothetical protein